MAFTNIAKVTEQKKIEHVPARRHGVEGVETSLPVPAALWYDMVAASPALPIEAASLPLHAAPRSSNRFFDLQPCSFGLSATSQQYFPLRTNQPPAKRTGCLLRSAKHTDGVIDQILLLG
jgi:hypothetical protein